MRLGKILSHEQSVPQLTSLRFLADSSKLSKNGLSQSRAKPLDRFICNGLFYVPSNPSFGKKLLRERWMHGLTRAFHMKKNLAEQKTNNSFRTKPEKQSAFPNW